MYRHFIVLFRLLKPVTMRSSLFAFFVLFFMVLPTTAVRFYAITNEKKCIKEQIHRNVIMNGEYEFSDAIRHKASVHVTDTRGHTLYKREEFTDLRGKFAFAADEDDIFEVCFVFHGNERIQREVSLILKHGFETKNYEDIGKAMNLKPMELELKRLEDFSESIVKDFADMREREEKLRNTNEATKSRVFYLSMASVGCLLLFAVGQVFYLRRYFKSKKLIQ